MKRTQVGTALVGPHFPCPSGWGHGVAPGMPAHLPMQTAPRFLTGEQIRRGTFWSSLRRSISSYPEESKFENIWMWVLKSKEGWGQYGEGGRKKRKIKETIKWELGEEDLSKQKTKYPVCIQEDSVLCHPGSWVPLFSSRAAFSLAFTRQAFPLVGGGRMGLGRALPFLISF